MSALSKKQSLVEFQKVIFAQIEAFQLRGDERLCLRAFSGNRYWAMDAGDILHVAQMPKALPHIPSAPNDVRGLIQQDGDVYTVFDLGYILTGVATPYSRNNRVLVLHPSMMPGVALLVAKTYSLTPMSEFEVQGTVKSDDRNDKELYTHSHLTLDNKNENEVDVIADIWRWLDFSALLSSQSFAIHRVDIHTR